MTNCGDWLHRLWNEQHNVSLVSVTGDYQTNRTLVSKIWLANKMKLNELILKIIVGHETQTKPNLQNYSLIKFGDLYITSVTLN